MKTKTATQREVDAARTRAWHAANPERAAAWRMQHPGYHTAHARAWRAAHPELARRACRASAKAWATRNPAQYHANAKAAAARRRTRIVNVLVTLTAAEWDAILDAAGRACIYCGSQKQLTQDHLTPISRGGDHTAENVAPACLHCNTSKGAKIVAEFLAEKED